MFLKLTLWGYGLQSPLNLILNPRRLILSEQVENSILNLRNFLETGKTKILYAKDPNGVMA